MVAKNKEMIHKTLDTYIHKKDITGLCNAIDDYVTNPAKKPLLPRAQNLTQNFQIPPRVKDIVPTAADEMAHRRQILRMGCKANSLYVQYKHLYWKNQDLLFDMLRRLQASIMAGDTLDDVQIDPSRFRYVVLRFIKYLDRAHMSPSPSSVRCYTKNSSLAF